jgi:hypothetical protein
MNNPVDDMIEILLPSGGNGKDEASRAEFLKIKETLTRMGIASRREKKLYQSAHILHKQGKYYICHFKEMFLLDGRQADFTDEDRVRRNIIATRLEEWSLLRIVDPSQTDVENKTAYIKIIPHSEKSEWSLVAKYNVGKIRGVKND